MQNMTIGKKIALGFGALILIAALLGAIAVFSMKAVQTQTQTLAEGYVPESQIAGDLQDAFANTTLAIRSYGFTADNSYLDEARKGLVEVHKHQQAAQKLSAEHPELVKLHENLKGLEPALAAFENLVDQTEAKNKEIVSTREKLNAAAATFMTNVDTLIAVQKGLMDNEIKANTNAVKIQERADKMLLLADIRNGGNAARIAIFKSLAFRDAELLDQGLKNFEVLNQKLEEITPLIHQQVNLDQLNLIKTSAAAYREAMKATRDEGVALAEINKKRTEARARVSELVQDTQDTGMKRTVEGATLSLEKLVSASWTMKIGLIGALLIAFAVAFLIIRNSNRVLTQVAHALDDGANQVVAASGQSLPPARLWLKGPANRRRRLRKRVLRWRKWPR